MKRKISNAFLECSKRKSVDKISVKDLVEECNISRQTFYYHFQDILAVLEWSFEQSMNEALQLSLKAESSEEAMKILVERAQEGSDILRRLLQSQKREFVEMTLIKTMEQFLEQLILIKNPYAYMNVFDKDAVLTFYASGITGVLMKYLSSGNMNTELIVKQLTRLLTEDIRHFARQD